MASYHLPEYWEERYRADTQPFEWYQRFSDLKPLIRDLFPPTSKVLVIGNGTSEFPFDLYDDADLNVKDITSIDISEASVKRMQTLIQDRKTIEFSRMDCLSMSFPANYDIVFDKATLDSILCGEGAADRAQKLLENTLGALKNQGVYICVSYGKPDMRLQYLQNEGLDWDVDVREAPRPKLLEGQVQGDDCHFVYVCRKRGEVVDTTKKGKK
ncbi:Methyltransferase [Spironucleus salmonicida]|uniref:Endothelin-converting enzyme 2 n=1 Tax=Spironucleus salmonicida TaxID=348837 RepID=V6LES3_9EUKA|nr:Methyltransferase [Spironucleus salmonicida]|eukprot:EST42997.1 Endothelin-converting enzyme 2 [Spironucleus salmonicida]